MIGKLLRALSGSESAAPSSEWEQLAESLGLRYRRGNRSSPTRMNGVIDGRKIEVVGYPRRPWEIEVEYESGLQDFSLHQLSRDVKVITNRQAVATGDAEFDRRYQLYSRSPEAAAAFSAWLTPARHSALLVLDDAFVITDLEEDELEVRLRSDATTTNELREAIGMCVSAARTFDRSSRPQDGEPSRPQDTIE